MVIGDLNFLWYVGAALFCAVCFLGGLTIAIYLYLTRGE